MALRKKIPSLRTIVRARRRRNIYGKSISATTFSFVGPVIVYVLPSRLEKLVSMFRLRLVIPFLLIQFSTTMLSIDVLKGSIIAKLSPGS